MPYRIFIDRFTSLDDLPKKDHGNARKVLAAIVAAGGRFSAFDATANQRIARTMTYIECESGWTKRRQPETGYPWVEIELTSAGEAVLANETGD